MKLNLDQLEHWKESLSGPVYACRECIHRSWQEERWGKLCDPLYRLSDRDHEVFKGSPLEEALAWESKDGRGLLISGRPDKGKTRAGFMILRRQFDKGIGCFAVNAVALARASADASCNDDRRREEANKILRRCEEAPLVLIDDLGQAKATERSELDLYYILETRASNMRPLIITTNRGEKEMVAGISADRSDAIIRRIIQFCHVLEF